MTSLSYSNLTLHCIGKAKMYKIGKLSKFYLMAQAFFLDQQNLSKAEVSILGCGILRQWLTWLAHETRDREQTLVRENGFLTSIACLRRTGNQVIKAVICLWSESWAEK
jgi:hypothetical protein|uniref:Uncharacterized protein n=1 Tax=Mus musculus TaxID=10090 RepID=Q8BGB1_MOUSE|nr:unnamed protein product [Mus musculus]